MRLAAIDIGSNAARLLISDVVRNREGRPDFNKLNLVRVPLRLGFDVFEKKEISPEKQEMIIQTIKAYKCLIDVYGVKYLKACATSAMRDAVNSAEIIDRVKSERGFSPKSCWIAHVLSDHGLTKRAAHNRDDPNLRAHPCPVLKRPAIEAALRHFAMI